MKAQDIFWKYTIIITTSWAGLCLSALLLVQMAWASPPQMMRINDAQSGTLMLPSQTPGHYVPAPHLASDVHIIVSGPIARTRVTQRFENLSEVWVEGIYVFPLPDGAAVDTLKMQIGERFIEGTIEERQKAKAIYEQAKKDGKKASLLEQQRPNIFTNAVANIGPGETVVIQIEYQETVRMDGADFSLRFPMVVAPRYTPGPAQKHLVEFSNDGGWGTVDPVPDRDAMTPPVLDPEAGPINPVRLTVDLRAGFPLGDVTSSFHGVTRTHFGKDHIQLKLQDGDVPADRDFELVWTPQAGTAPNAALFRQDSAGDSYYLLMVTPPTDTRTAAPLARDITFVIDTSGSMQGASMRQAKDSLALAVSRLKPTDRFNIVEFNSTHTQLFRRSQAASEESLSTALSFIRALEADGGTEMLPALKTALLPGDTPDGRLRQVVFLTDGAIGNEQQLFDTIAQNRGNARIFTIGIGSAPNAYFMTRAAQLGQGTFTHIGDVNQVQKQMTALLKKLETPAITHVDLAWPDGSAAQMWPAPVPDLYHGETLVIAAKAQASAGTISLSGDHDGARWQVDLPLEGAAQRSGIAKLWARKKIASLDMARAHYGADIAAIDTAVLKTALTHGLVSRLTSLIAVDKDPSRPNNAPITSVDMPVNLPQGWDFGAVFGTANAAQTKAARKAFAPQLLQASAAPAQEGLAALMPAPAPMSAGVPLPQTATLADVKIAKGLWLLLIGLGFAWWYRRER